MSFLTQSKRQAICSEHILGLSSSDREQFATSLVDWFVKLLKYYRHTRWEEKKVGKQSHKTHIIRTNPHIIADFKMELEGEYGIKSQFELRVNYGPFDKWQEMQDYMQSTIDTIQNALRILDVDKQSKRMSEIMAGVNSVM